MPHKYKTDKKELDRMMNKISRAQEASNKSIRKMIRSVRDKK